MGVLLEGVPEFYKEKSEEELSAHTNSLTYTHSLSPLTKQAILSFRQHVPEEEATPAELLEVKFSK